MSESEQIIFGMMMAWNMFTFVLYVKWQWEKTKKANTEGE